jgi:hypothetical protein
MKLLAIGPQALLPSKLPRCRGVYLIHFTSPYTSVNGKKTIQHYLAFAERSIRARIDRHKAGNGARLMQVITAAGIEWEAVHLWLEASRSDER